MANTRTTPAETRNFAKAASDPVEDADKPPPSLLAPIAEVKVDLRPEAEVRYCPVDLLDSNCFESPEVGDFRLLDRTIPENLSMDSVGSLAP